MWDGFGAGTFAGYTVLGGLWEKFVGEFTEPGFEHGTNDIDVVEVALLEEIDVKF